MSITITDKKIFTRPHAGVVLQMDSGSALMTALINTKNAFIAAGNLTFNSETSADGITTTNTLTFNSLEAFSAYDTAIGIDFDAEFMDSYASIGIVGQWVQSGINQPFTCTTVWNFPTTTAAHDQLVNSIQEDPAKKLTNLSVTATAITAVHTYDNSEDFNSTFFYDAPLAPALHSAGVTRTISYALV